MAWLAFDRAIALSKRFGLEAPVQRWKRIRGQIRDEILDSAMRSSIGPTTRSATPSRNPMAPRRWTPAR
jgi:hypothetical protein